MQRSSTSPSKFSTAEFIHDHQMPIAAKCLSTLSLDGLDPISDVKAALGRQTLLSAPRISAPIIGSVYVFLKGRTRWGDGLRWPFKTHRNARDGQDYNIYHGAAQGHLSEMIRASCTVYLGEDAYGVVYFLSHVKRHSVEAYAKYFMDSMVTVYGTREEIHSVIRRVVKRARDKGNQIGSWQVAASEEAAYEPSVRDDANSCEGDTSVGDDGNQAAYKHSISYIVN